MSSDEITTLSVGQQIKADREAVGMTIEQLAQATRIMANFIEALEKDDMAALPGKVFGKGFIKSIYKVFGKDPREVLAKFDDVNGAEHARDVPVTQVESLHTEIVTVESEARRFPIYLVGGAALIGIAVLALIWALGSKPSEKAIEASNIEPPVQADDRASPETVEQDALDPESVVSVQSFETETKEDVEVGQVDQHIDPESVALQAEGTSGGTSQLLEIVVRKAVKIRMNFDHKGWETKELSPDTYQFRFEDAANLLVYDAGAVEMSFNGKNLGSLGSEGRVRRLTFVAGGPQASKKM